MPVIRRIRLSRIRLPILIILILFLVLLCNIDTNFDITTLIGDDRSLCEVYPNQFTSVCLRSDEWQPTKRIPDEQNRLYDMAIIVAAQSKTVDDNVPTVPCLSSDRHLLVLSVAASRVRYGTTLTFVIVYPTDVKAVLPKGVPSEPLFSHQLSLWCIFDDKSVTPAYSYDSNYYNERTSFLDCPLSPFASDQLWRYNKTLRVHLASITDKDQGKLILKAFINVPKPAPSSLSTSHEQLTLCTSPLHDQANYLVQWIEFHRLVGFRKFVIYNTSDTDNRLSAILNIYTRKYPGLVDVVQWNFWNLSLTDVTPTRYFQTGALHDCLVRYSDQSEWLGMFDLDEYIVPLHSYKTVSDYLYSHFGRRIIGSVNLRSQSFCTKNTDKYTPEENDITRLTIERFTFRARHRYKGGREKYLYRPRFVQYLSIHQQLVGLHKKESSENHILLAHYASIRSLRSIQKDCNAIEDTSIRDRFANDVKSALIALTTEL